MKPGHVASSAVDYLARKKGLILNSSDISKTILANVEAAEHKGVVVPPGTTVGYVLTVNENNQSSWEPSELSTFLDTINVWTNEQEYVVPPRITYEYSSEPSNQVATTEYVVSSILTSNTTNGLPEILTNNSVSSLGQAITLLASDKSSVLSASELRMNTIENEVPVNTIYSGSQLSTTGQYTIAAGNQGIQMGGQFTFDTPPHSISPILGNDVATKGYVDTLIGNYSGSGVNLYLNSSGVTSTSILSPGLISNSLIVTTSTITTNCIAEFTTEIKDNYTYPNTTTIPSGIWNMSLYGKVNINTKILKYYFELYKVNASGETFLKQSNQSIDINTVSAIPDVYHVDLPIVDPITILPTDQLRIKVFVTSADAAGVTLSTYFGGLYYSFITTTLSGGISILTMDNTYTGNNVYQLQVAANGGITTNTFYGTTLSVTTVNCTHNIAVNTINANGQLNSSGGINTTTLSATGLIQAANGITVTQGVLRSNNGISSGTFVNTNTLTVDGGATISGVLNAVGGIIITAPMTMGDITSTGNLIVSGGVSVGSGMTVAGGITTSAPVYTGALTTTGNATVSGLLSSLNGLTVYGNATVSGGMTVSGGITALGGITTFGAPVYTGNLVTTGTASVSKLMTAFAGINVYGGITVSNGITIGGDINVLGSINTYNSPIYTNNLIATGYAVVRNLLSASGGLTVYGGIIMSGGITALGGVTTSKLYVTSGSTFDGLITATNGISASSIYTSSIVSSNIANIASLYTTNTGNVKIGGLSTIVETSGIRFQGNLMDSTDTYSGSIGIGYYQIAGSIDIGTNQLRTGNINIGETLCNVFINGAIRATRGISVTTYGLTARAGISSNTLYVTSGSTFDGLIRATNGISVTTYGLTANAGISSNTLYVTSGSTFDGLIAATNGISVTTYGLTANAGISSNTLYVTSGSTFGGLITANANISGQTIVANTLTTDVNLYTTQTGGTINVGSTTISVDCSNINLQGNSINNAFSPTTGALLIGDAQTSGTIGIGTNALRTSIITIGTSGTTTHVSGISIFGSTINSISTSAITIGTSGTTIRVSGVSIYNNALNSSSSTTALSIADGQTSGVLTLGTNTARTGAISIGGNNCTINVGGYLTPIYTALPASSAIGYRLEFTLATTAINASNNFILVDRQISVGIGTWLAIGNVSLPAVNSVAFNLTIWTAAGTLNTYATNTVFCQSTITSAVQVQYVIQNATTSSNWGLYARCTVNTQSVTDGRITLLRIA